MQEPDQPITKKAKRITTGLLAVILVFLLILFLFWRITDEIVLEQETTFDTNIHKFLAAYTTPATTKMMLLFTFLGSREFLLPAYTLLAAFFLFYKRSIIQALGIVVIGLISRGLLLLFLDYLLTWYGKQIFPQDGNGYYRLSFFYLPQKLL